MVKHLIPQLELELLDSGLYDQVVGIDEVGRGSWAGPVTVGAFIFTKDTTTLTGVRDSKLLNLKQRESIHPKVTHKEFKIAFGEVEEIDILGVGHMIEKLIEQMIFELSTPRTYFIIDGRFAKNFGDNTKMIIDGDNLHYSIALASILAKVERDRLMNDLAQEYAGYGFEKNKGYGTVGHRLAIRELGICAIHRKSYEPIRKFTNL